MRANEFEKQVQQKMEELQLRPSPEVWEEVEKQIRKDKKRRRIIFWWLLPLLLTGAISFIIVQNENKSNSIADSTINNQTLPTESKPNEPVSIPAPTTTDNPALSSDKPVVDDISKKANPDDLPVISKDKKDILTRNSNQRLNLRRQSPVNIPGNTNITVSQQTNIEKTDQLFPTKEKTTAILDKDDKAIVKNEEVNKELIQPKVSEPLIAETKKDLANADSNTLVTVPTEMIKAETEKEKATVTISNPSLPLKNEKDPKWELGVEARAGLSNTWKGELFHLRKVVEVYSSSPNIGTGSGTAAGPFAPTVLIESPEQSFTGSLQVLAQRKLSTRLSVNFGLQYNYLSTRVKVGSEVQSSRFISNDFSSSVVVNSYYRPEGNSDYINRYHLLGVSAGLSWKLI